ncbi:Pyridoxal phosphate-dependent decarboxylase domain containing protein [Aphelenchoides besseyi]|nr:Pyridoxal phosphate-dependent decarboxylase domain containing protein [Aphelenchoides besseyi]KAI6193032.1 Pyridoxal phosphate-dependent decarboxylase domain containing protein [Aphelenchoides besseyi]
MQFVTHGAVVTKHFAVEAIAGANRRLARYQPLVLIFGSIFSTWLFLRLRHFVHQSEKTLWSRFKSYAFQLFRRIPAVRKRIERELDKTFQGVLTSIHECDKERDHIKVLPTNGMNAEDILARVQRYDEMNQKFDFKSGRVSGTVYTDMREDLLEMLTSVFKRYAYSNPLHPDIFPGARKMEAEIIRMVANLFHGDVDACGTMSSGGTESILLACLAHRNRALANGIENPVIVAPITAHAAFEKAAQILGCRIRHVKVDTDGRVNLAAMRRAIDGDVCMLVGSAPCFSTGTFDEIPEISKLGIRYNIPVHVDACLGGFLIAFIVDEIPIPHFDFRLPGVTSISCDTHKYGYSPKGSSVVLYRDITYLHHQYFCINEWPGGIYATPTIAGSRAGLNIALTWATLLHFGHAAYKERAMKIVQITRYLAAQIVHIRGIQLVGTPDVSIVAFRSNDFNIYAVADLLQKRGWNLNSLQNPDGIHFCITYNQASQEVIDAFLTDLNIVCEEVRQLPDRGGKTETAVIYGMAGTLPDRSLIDEVAHAYLDACYALPERPLP